jgi:hypothetical protein
MRSPWAAYFISLARSRGADGVEAHGLGHHGLHRGGLIDEIAAPACCIELLIRSEARLI